MAYRRKLDYSGSQRYFTRNTGTHRYNLNVRNQRGGGRL